MEKYTLMLLSWPDSRRVKGTEDFLKGVPAPDVVTKPGREGLLFVLRSVSVWCVIGSEKRGWLARRGIQSSGLKNFFLSLGSSSRLYNVSQTKSTAEFLVE